MKTIKDILSIGLLVAVLLFQSGCSDDPTPVFEADMRLEFVIPNSEINPLLRGTLTIPDVSTFFSQNAAINGISADQVTSIAPGRASITASFQNVDLSFIDEISVQVVNRTDNNMVAEMFYLNNIPFNEGTSANLFGSLGELKDLLSEDIVDIQIVFDYRTTIPVDFIGEIQLTYLVFTE